MGSGYKLLPENVRSWFMPFILVLSFLAGLSYLISSSLLKPLAWAVLLSFLVYPLYDVLFHRIFKGRHPNLAALLMTAFIILMIVQPAVMIGFVMAKQGIKFYANIAGFLKSFDNDGIHLLPFFPSVLAERLAPVFKEFEFLRTIMGQTGNWVASMVASASRNFLGNVIRIVLQLVVIAVASFFMIRDGHLILGYVKDITPLTPQDKDAFFLQAKRILQGVLYGITLTAIVQGILGGIGWWYVGLPTPLLFGALMALLAMFPIIGTPLVWIPGCIYLFYTGEWKSSIILFVWGALVVSLIDNFLRPLFISEGSNIHILIIFIGVFGGLATWGFIGVFLGPLVISLFVFMLDTYRKKWKRYFEDN